MSSVPSGLLALGSVVLAALAGRAVRGRHGGRVVRRRLEAGSAGVGPSRRSRRPDAATRPVGGRPARVETQAAPASARSVRLARCVRSVSSVRSVGVARCVRSVAGRPGSPGRRRRAEVELVAWIDGATRVVRAGGSLRHALVSGVAALPAPGPELARLHDDLLASAPLDEALGRFEAGHPSPSAQLAARSISLAGETGGRPAHLLESIGFTVRERLECDREARALSTQARSSAVVIMVAPVGFAAVAAGADGRVAGFLFGTFTGFACIAGGLALEAVGCWWMARLVGRLA